MGTPGSSPSLGCWESVFVRCQELVGLRFGLHLRMCTALVTCHWTECCLFWGHATSSVPACAGKAGACFEESLCRSGRGHGQATRSPSTSPWRRRGSLVLLLRGPVMPANWPPSVLRNSCPWAPVWWEPSAPSFSFVCIAVLGLRVSGVIFQGEEKHPPSSRQPGAGTQLLSFTPRHAASAPRDVHV